MRRRGKCDVNSNLLKMIRERRRASVNLKAKTRYPTIFTQAYFFFLLCVSVRYCIAIIFIVPRTYERILQDLGREKTHPKRETRCVEAEKFPAGLRIVKGILLRAR